jgi:hypothetical protein
MQEPCTAYMNLFNWFYRGDSGRKLAHINFRVEIFWTLFFDKDANLKNGCHPANNIRGIITKKTQA